MSTSVSHGTEFSSEKIAAQIEQRRAGNRKKVHHGGKLCSNCFERPPVSGGYCARCHAAYEAKRRKSEREDLKRLRALEQQLSKGKDDGEDRNGADRQFPTVRS